MSDIGTLTAEEVEAAQAKLEEMTKKGFDLKARLKGRGLRKGSITLYLDELTGPELGWAYDLTNKLGFFVKRVRHGVLGELDNVEELKAKTTAAYDLASAAEDLKPAEKTKLTKEYNSIIAAFDAKINELESQRDDLVQEITHSGLTIAAQAVPTVIQKDCRRKAKATLEIKGKNIPEDLAEDFEMCEQAHLMAAMIQSITDNATGHVNLGATYEDAVDLMGMLPPGQFQRLDAMLGDLQFTDNISLSIESQEDFS
jgi:hypothetical protein